MEEDPLAFDFEQSAPYVCRCWVMINPDTRTGLLIGPEIWQENPEGAAWICNQCGRKPSMNATSLHWRELA